MKHKDLTSKKLHVSSVIDIDNKIKSHKTQNKESFKFYCDYPNVYSVGIEFLRLFLMLEHFSNWNKTNYLIALL